MIPDGIRTGLLPAAVLVDDLLAIREGSTSRISVDALVEQIVTAGPFAALWPDLVLVKTVLDMSGVADLVVDPDAHLIVLLGYASAGDGGGGAYARVDSPPAHAAKFQTSDGQWWELCDWEPNPKQFGAPWNGVDDDLAATHACSYFCRVTSRAMRLPPGAGYFSDNLFLGSLTVRGAGPANRHDAYRSKTVLVLAGNPGLITMKDAASAYNSGSTNLEYFTCVPDVHHDVSKTKTTTIWDNNAYPYRIGIHLGRPPAFMQTVAGGEGDGQGTGLITLRGVDLDGFSGMGIYGYKVYGKSLIDDCYIRRCGGAGAYDEGSNRYCGAIRFDSETADIIISNVHTFHDGYPNPDGSIPNRSEGESSVYDNRGFGLRLGANKALVEAAPLDRKWFPTGKVRLVNTQIEAPLVPLDVRATTWLHVGDGCILNGHDDGIIYLGDPDNPRTQNRVTFGRVYLNNVGTIVQRSGSAVDLGDLVVFDQVEIQIYAGVKVGALGGGVDSTGLDEPNVTLTPMPDPEGDLGVSASGVWKFLPWFSTNGFQAGTIEDQRLPVFGVSGFVGWAVGDPTATFNSPWSATLSSGGNIYYDVSGLSPGALMTAQVFFRQPSTFNTQAIEYGIKNGSGEDRFRRKLGPDGDSEQAFYRRAFQFLVPEDGVARLFLYSAGPSIEVLHPCMSAGAAPMLPERPLLHWPTPDEIVACS